MYPALEVLKSDRLAARPESDDLPVDDDRLRPAAGPLCERRRYLWKLRRLVVAEPRPQAHGFALSADLGDGADAVVLGFVDERRIIEWCVGQRREHRPQHCKLQIVNCKSAKTAPLFRHGQRQL